MKPEKLVNVWLAGLAVLLDRRYDGPILIPAGRLVGEALEHPAGARFDEIHHRPMEWFE